MIKVGYFRTDGVIFTIKLYYLNNCKVLAKIILRYKSLVNNFITDEQVRKIQMKKIILNDR
jgi:hypothetical protein